MQPVPLPVQALDRHQGLVHHRLDSDRELGLEAQLFGQARDLGFDPQGEVFDSDTVPVHAIRHFGQPRRVAVLEGGSGRGAGHDKLVEPFFFLDLEPAILDTKVIEGIAIASRMKTSLEKMEYGRVADEYFPDFVELPEKATEDDTERRFLLVLKRGNGPAQVARRLRQFRQRLSELP